MTAPKAGYKGAIYVDNVKIGGATVWNQTGGTRNMQPIDEFEDEHIKHLPLQIDGGEITITGNCLIGDAGQVLLNTHLAAGTEITNIKLYIDKTGNTYYIPDVAFTSYVTVTNSDAVGDDKSGVATFSATLKVSGMLKRVA